MSRTKSPFTEGPDKSGAGRAGGEVCAAELEKNGIKHDDCNDADGGDIGESDSNDDKDSDGAGDDDDDDDDVITMVMTMVMLMMTTTTTRAMTMMIAMMPMVATLASPIAVMTRIAMALMTMMMATMPTATDDFPTMAIGLREDLFPVHGHVVLGHVLGQVLGPTYPWP